MTDEKNIDISFTDKKQNIDPMVLCVKWLVCYYLDDVISQG